MKCNIQSVPIQECEWTVEKLLQAHRGGFLPVNPEYQRGAVWKEPQMRMLIDSMLREYYIPLIYLHRATRKAGEFQSDRYEIIDGQQRINAIRSFVDGFVVERTKSDGKAEYRLIKGGKKQAFGALFDPCQADRGRFPAFLHGQRCWWAGKKFKASAGSAAPAFSEQEQQQFMQTKIAVALVDCEKVEACDMFIRLQGGSDLQPQEKRDAWPGDFCKKILEIGGKDKKKTEYEGHRFFSDVIGQPAPGKDRGKTREIAATMLMIFLKRKQGLHKIPLGVEALNNCYHEYVTWGAEASEVELFDTVLGHLADNFIGGKKPLMNNKKTYAIHLMLLVESLLDVAPAKIGEVAGAFLQFATKVEKAKKDAKKNPVLPDSADKDAREIWEFADTLKGFGVNPKILARRHEIFTRQMFQFLGMPGKKLPYLLANPAPRSNAAEPLPLVKPQSSLQVWSVKKLIDARDDGMLQVNSEYQRGEVWNNKQMRLLIDSLMRNYQIPLIYLHKVERDNPFPELGGKQGHYEIVDGQQRIDSLCSFKNAEGSAKFPALFDPSGDGKELFPEFIQQQACEWGGKTYNGLSQQLKDEFDKKKIAVVEVECEPNSPIAKDMFIRLQGGTALRPQEIRDAWPGNFGKLVLEIGGKQGIAQGYDFFCKLLKSPGKGGFYRRELVAQLLMLYLSRKQKEADDGAFTDLVTVDGDKLDAFYRRNVELSLDSPEVRRFREILVELWDAFAGAKNPGGMKATDMIHLVLFADMLKGDYVPSWTNTIADEHFKFTASVVVADQKRKEGKSDGVEPELLDYSVNAARDTRKAASIQRRHQIYVRAMLDFMGDSIKRKDPKRAYTSDERSYIFYRDGGLCQNPDCGREVPWRDVDIHHKELHSEGGQTTLENAVLMCRECHRDLHKKRKGGE